MYSHAPPFPHPHDLGVTVDDGELPHCVYTCDCVIDATQPSLDAYHHPHYPSEKYIQSVCAGIRIIIEPPNTPIVSLFLQRPLITSLSFQHGSLKDATTVVYDEMTAFLNQPPGSPPDLTESKSSKSSSFRSSSISDADVILPDITHFEDIGLDEDWHPSSLEVYGYDCSKRSVTPSLTGTMNASMGMTNSTGSMRDLTNGVRRPSYPGLQNQTRGAARHTSLHALNLPSGRTVKRSSTSPSTPSLAKTAMSNLNRSRSPSPSFPLSRLQAPLPQIPTAKHPPVRRGSWQPSRKSTKELEDEYDDLDENLPDDASLWNVPLSPRPASERGSISATNSANVSPSTSPERKSPARSLGNVGMAALPSPLIPSSLANPLLFSNHGAISPSSLKPRHPRGNSTGTMPEDFQFSKNRAKTWDVAMSELSEEAKSLTEALENHAGFSELQQEAAVQNGALDKSIMDKVSKSRTKSVELPPLRISNVMIDPLPVSKEKEKVLSRTRPSWLPPKDRKEEKKHLKEYQRMMEMSQEAERKKAARAVDVQCAQDDTKAALLRIWEGHVLSNWDHVIREPRTRELWWRGVAPGSRGRVWERAIGNGLALTDVTYAKALQRAKDTEKRMAAASPDDIFKEKAWFTAIRRDIQTVFPELSIFQLGNLLYNDLLDVLMAYSMYRSDVGYSHGTHLIAALLLLTLPNPSATFLALANLLNRPLPLAFLTGDPIATGKAYALVCSLLARRLPRLHKHLFSPSPHGLGLAPAQVLEPMMRTLFLGPGRGVGADAAVRLWDIMMFEGDGVVVRGAVGVLAGLEASLYGGREEILELLGWAGVGCWEEAADGVEALVKRVRGAGKGEELRGTRD